MASILALWMKSVPLCPSFIEERYWHESEAIVRDASISPPRANLGYGRKWTTERLRQRPGSSFCRGAVCRPRRVRHGIGKGFWNMSSNVFPSAEP
ncbi:hypothetical protein KCP74_06710 [Salmonella enterica subsp. enterica]|nr:hypothetical protein KCP74_06710 [Salmonella enterica subsp. enterica]